MEAEILEVLQSIDQAVRNVGIVIAVELLALLFIITHHFIKNEKVK